jgi:hypothetical protein
MRAMGEFPRKSVQSVRSVRRQVPAPCPGGLEASEPPPVACWPQGSRGGSGGFAAPRGAPPGADGLDPAHLVATERGEEGGQRGEGGCARAQGRCQRGADWSKYAARSPSPGGGHLHPPLGDPGSPRGGFGRYSTCTRAQRRFLRGDAASPHADKGSPRLFSRVARGFQGSGGAVAAHPGPSYLPRRAQDPARGAQPDPAEAKENNVPLIGRP